MLGYNVLHPQSFHCTGLPILGAAKRIAEREPKQWEILRQMGIPDREIPKFADPMHWIEVFPAGTMADLKALGAAVDWTRSFITTPLNPPYDAFVRWQFLHLKAGGYGKIDEHPVGRAGRLRRPAGSAAGRRPAREVWTGRGTRSKDQADPDHPDARLGPVARGRGGRAVRDPEPGGPREAGTGEGRGVQERLLPRRPERELRSVRGRAR